MKKFILCFIILITAVTASYCTIPSTINYEGRLTNQYGTPETTSKTMTFAIYDALSGGTKIWPAGTPPDYTVTVNDGIFNVILGSNGDAIPVSTFTSSAVRYLQVTVNSESMSPRTQIVSVGYAMKASSAEVATTLSSGFVSSVSSAGATALTGAVVLKGGSNVTLTQGGQVITIEATSSGGSGTVTSVATGRGLSATPNPITTTGIISVDATIVTLEAAQTLLNKTMSTGSTWNGTAVGATFGGTGLTTYNTGDLIYGSNSNTLSRLATTGAEGKVLKVVSGLPSWEAAGGTGTVTQVNTGAGLTGGPVTTTGTISVAAGGITSALIATGAVTSGAIANNTITAANMGTGSVTSDAILNGTIQRVDIASGQVVTAIGSAGATPLTDIVTLAAGSGIRITQIAGQITIESTASGGTVTQVNTGRGIIGGPITTTGTLTVDTAVVVTTSDAQTISGSKTFSSQIVSSVTTGTAPLSVASTTKVTNLNADLLDDLDSAAFALQTTLNSHTTAATAVHGLSAGSAVVGTSETQTLTNKTMSTGSVWNGTAVGPTFGGTGLTTYNTGDLIYGSNSNTLSRLSTTGAEGKVLKVVSGIPSWEPVSGTGTVTQVNTGQGLTGGPVTTTGTISIAAGGIIESNFSTGSVTSGAIANGTIQRVDIASGQVVTAIGSMGATPLTDIVTLAAGSGIRITQIAGQITIESTASGGTVTQVNTGRGIIGGPITSTGTLTVDTAVVVTTSDAQTISGSKTFSSQIVSSVTTGTAPLSVASTTKVTNLNSDLLDDLDSTAFALQTTLNSHTTAATAVHGLSAGSAVVGTSETQTLTNKTMSTGSVWNGTAVGPTFGGTGLTTYNTGDLIYGSNSNTLSRLSTTGAEGKVLKVVSGIPSWEPVSGTGTVTSIGAGYGLTSNPNPITSSGVLTIDATIVATIDGTGKVLNANLLDGLDSTAFALQTTLNSHTTAATAVHGLSAGSTVVGTSETQTLTNKTINAPDNTITNIQRSNIASGQVVTAIGSAGATPLTDVVTIDAGSGIRVTQISGRITIESTTSGGTVTQVNTGRGIIGGPITSTGTLTVDTAVVVTTSDAQTISGSKTFSSQIVSSVTTGTAPLSVASTTKVTNLNADLLDDLDSTAFALQTTLNSHTTAATAVHGLSAGSAVVGTSETQTLTNKTFIDGSTFVVDTADVTKRVTLEVSVVPAAETRLWNVGTGIPQSVEAFTASGTWTRPAGVGRVYVQVWGAGGGGVTGTGNSGGGGGGGGGYSAGLVDVSGNVTVTVGTGGGAGAAGGNSSFAGAVTLTGNGGSAATTVNGGAGGTGTGGTINITGGTGGTSVAANGAKGACGGGSPFGGSGGGGGLGETGSVNGTNGTTPGGGGGGGSEPGGIAGSGADGLVIVYY